MNKEKKTITVTVEDVTPFYYGQHLFVISPCNQKRLTEKCPVCDGTNKISVRGFEMNCPYCFNNYNSNNNISINDYEVVEYIIYKMEIKGETNKSIYKKDCTPIATVSYAGFCKRNVGFAQVTTKGFSNRDLAETYHNVPYTVDRSSNKIIINGDTFFKRSEAEKVIRELHEIQREMLENFNKIHGTEYEYPFDN